MKLPVCAVFDKKCGMHDNPFLVRHTAEAIREFNIVTKDPQTKLGKNPEDFDLMEIATFDPNTGQFQNLENRITLQTGV